MSVWCLEYGTRRSKFLHSDSLAEHVPQGTPEDVFDVYRFEREFGGQVGRLLKFILKRSKVNGSVSVVDAICLDDNMKTTTGSDFENEDSEESDIEEGDIVSRQLSDRDMVHGFSCLFKTTANPSATLVMAVDSAPASWRLFIDRVIPESSQNHHPHVKRGVFCFYGEGKTSKLRALKSEFPETHAFWISPCEIIHGELGASQATVRQIFHNARSHSPGLVILDDADLLFKSTGRISKDILHELCSCIDLSPSVTVALGADQSLPAELCRRL